MTKLLTTNVVQEYTKKGTASYKQRLQSLSQYGEELKSLLIQGPQLSGLILGQAAVNNKGIKKGATAPFLYNKLN
jgi:hypothetical protein